MSLKSGVARRGRLWGIPVQIHVSWLVIFGLMRGTGLAGSWCWTGGRLVGYLSVKDVMHVLAVSTARGQRRLASGSV